MCGRLGIFGPWQMPRRGAVNGAERQLKRPRSRSVPRGMCSSA